MAEATLAYLDLLADERFEARVPRRLKKDAETVAKAAGFSLSEYVLRLLAERVAEELPRTQQWRLTPDEQATLLRLLAQPSEPTTALEKAREQAKKLFGPNP